MAMIDNEITLNIEGKFFVSYLMRQIVQEIGFGETLKLAGEIHEQLQEQPSKDNGKGKITRKRKVYPPQTKNKRLDPDKVEAGQKEFNMTKYGVYDKDGKPLHRETLMEFMKGPFMTLELTRSEYFKVFEQWDFTHWELQSAYTTITTDPKFNPQLRGLEEELY